MSKKIEKPLTSQSILEKSRRFSRYLRVNEIKQADLADQLGISRQTINKLVRGWQNLTYDWAVKIAPLIGTTPEYLIEGDDTEKIIGTQQRSCVPIPSLACPAGAGGGRLIEAEPAAWGQPVFFDETLICDKIRASPRNLCAITIEGQSMEPILQNGDNVLINREKNYVSEPGIFVLFDGDGIVCKWVERIAGSEPAQYRIKSENPRFTTYTVLAEQTQILGRVVWYGRVL